MGAKANNQNKFMRCITLPIRVLCKARDLYVRSITNCAGKGSYGNLMNVASGQVYSLPKSYSVGSSRSTNETEDLRELVRAASAGRLGPMGNRVVMELYIQQQMRESAAAGAVPRSCSVGMDKIDEDGPYDFGEDKVNLKTELLYPRSKSYAVPKRSGVAF